ncbi:hypothetical protein BKK51_10355 [Rodentibacter trehalosifermentans]|uniref:Uncharacterized protein n=1 Tax=Rodentibacter trehalosifermentans TaxID=1908263 RepID=A0A1V3INT7_9PAST|nr:MULTISPECIES: hypothetical protein [Rodentibacter]MDC2825913.1 hypothetical protein [Rodentibacter pneumotropicus]OOF43935.1 hypothetical protein BKK51_10355 [Rodentibacter trehalosifermentans]
MSDKKTIKSSSWIKSAVKWLFISFVTLALFIGFAAFSMNHSEGVLALLSNIRSHRFMWLGIRGVIYAVCAYYLYRIYHLAKNEEDRIAYKRLIRAMVILFGTVELFNLYRG